MTRFSTFLLVVLSFVGGAALVSHKEDVRTFFNNIKTKKADQPPAKCCPAGDCKCPGCDGACEKGQMLCPCEPLTCMDGCKCQCPNKGRVKK